MMSEMLKKAVLGKLQRAMACAGAADKIAIAAMISKFAAVKVAA